MQLLLNKIKNIVREAASAGQGIETLFLVLAQRYEKQGDFWKAITCYQAGLSRAASRDSRRLFRVLQYWQFHLERAFHMAGQARVQDPLFSCWIQPRYFKATECRKAPGRFEASWTHQGLRLDGFVLNRKITRLQARIKKRLVCTIPIRKRGFLPGYFHYLIKRDVLELFPRAATLEVCDERGEALEWEGSRSAQFSIPHGKNTLQQCLDQGAVVNKKGLLTPPPEEIKVRQDRCLKIYDKASFFFQKHLQKPLFLMYGNLLGYHREGDFIAGDDDFDAGYISYHTDVHAVKKEVKSLVVDLVLAGFTVTFNRSGRLFRLRLAEDHPHDHLDIRPVWYEQGHVWAHLQACLPLALEDFLPVRQGSLRGTTVNVPCNTEAFLQAYYGPGWRVPDPEYSNASRRPGKKVTKKLETLCLKPSEYKEMQAAIQAARPHNSNAGTLASVGSWSLYPLDQFESICGW